MAVRDCPKCGREVINNTASCLQCGTTLLRSKPIPVWVGLLGGILGFVIADNNAPPGSGAGTEAIAWFASAAGGAIGGAALGGCCWPPFARAGNAL
jgi:hypothetical protein